MVVTAYADNVGESSAEPKSIAIRTALNANVAVFFIFTDTSNPCKQANFDVFIIWAIHNIE